MSDQYPPYQITTTILNLCSQITRLLGQFEGIKAPIPQPQLRKQSRIKTIYSSLAIEGNRLTMEQVADIINNKKVVGPQKDILEVKNAIKVYGLIHSFRANQLHSLLKAHAILMSNLIDDAGALRSRNVGIFSGSTVEHMAPKYQLVPKLMQDLFAFLKNKDDLHPLIKSSIFHYELEFIHPFSDGNGRMGRLWQTVILANFHPLFEYIPIESIIRKKQKHYYQAIKQADNAGLSTGFVEFMLEVIYEAAKELFAELKIQPQTMESRLNLAKEHFLSRSFSRKDYLAFHKDISTATASRDLLFGVKQKLLTKSGSRALTRYSFVSGTIQNP